MATTSTSIPSKGASGYSLNGGRSAAQWSRAGATRPKRLRMRWPFGANAAVGFRAPKITNGAMRFARGLPPTPALLAGRVRQLLPGRAAASALADVAGSASPPPPPLVGNFEAASGPVYGVLLDDLAQGWRRQVRATSDLGDLLASATKRPPTTDLAVAAARYDGAALRTAEETRNRAQQVRVTELRRRFVDGPVLTMPAGGSGTSDTTGSVSMPGVGTVFFRNFTLSARSGRLNANDGHAELRVGGAASGASWLLYDRSREVIPSEAGEAVSRFAVFGVRNFFVASLAM
jgi:hypothetical protein